MDDVLHVSVNGPRKRTIQIENDASRDLGNVFPRLTAAAYWIYSEPREAEVRHSLLAHEIAREWPAGVSFFAGFEAIGEDALSAARMAYRLHVQGATEKSIKALGDLRKTLAEDVSKVSQQSRELISSLWRDLTIALTAVLGRLLLSLGDKSAADSTAVRLMLFLTAVFIAVSAGATLVTNSQFAKLYDKSIPLWRTKLYAFLDDDEMQKFAILPLTEARAIYTRLTKPVVVLYAATALALVLFAFHTTNAGKQTATGDATPSLVPTDKIAPKALPAETSVSSSAAETKVSVPSPQAIAPAPSKSSVPAMPSSAGAREPKKP